MEPDAALGIVAQIAVALAGFAGVVTAFRSQSVHEWDSVDRLRLRLLLINSVLPLAFCLFALALLAIKPVPLHIWRWCSGILLAVSIPFFANVTRRFRSHAPAELHSGQVNRGAFLFFGVLGSLSLLLQLQPRGIECVLGVLRRDRSLPVSCDVSVHDDDITPSEREEMRHLFDVK
jgi:hypothetical protein